MLGLSGGRKRIPSRSTLGERYATWYRLKRTFVVVGIIMTVATQETRRMALGRCKGAAFFRTCGVISFVFFRCCSGDKH